MQYESYALFTGAAPVHCRRSWEAYPNVSPWLRSCKVSPINGSPRLPSGRGRDVTGACKCPGTNENSGMQSWPNQREKERDIPAASWLSALKRMHGISCRNISCASQVRPERVPDGAVPMYPLDYHVTLHLQSEISAPADASRRA